MAYIIAIASGKGGVGKTLVTASLAVLLERQGYSVLAADADMGLRDLDLLFGMQDEVLYDAVDVLKERCTAEEAIIPIMPHLDFLAASQKHTWEKVDAPSFHYLIESLAKNYDYILIDCPPGRGRAYKDAVAIADRIFFVVEPTWSSIRDTSRVMQFCDKHKQFHYAIVFNNFYEKAPGFVTADEAMGALNADHVAGLLPHDSDINSAVMAGSIVHVKDDNPFFQALRETVAYIEKGKDIPIESLKELLPDGEGPATVAGDSGDAIAGVATDALHSAALQELARAAAHTIPVAGERASEAAGAEAAQEMLAAEDGADPVGPAAAAEVSQTKEETVQEVSAQRLSWRTRRSQSRAWRQYRR